MTTLQTQTIYRLEERIDGTLVHSVCHAYADTAEAWDWFYAEASAHPLRYAPHRHARLVLLAVGGVR